jgi:hypothetical protein
VIKMIAMLVVLMMLMLREEYNFEGNHGYLYTNSYSAISTDSSLIYDLE